MRGRNIAFVFEKLRLSGVDRWDHGGVPISYVTSPETKLVSVREPGTSSNRYEPVVIKTHAVALEDHGLARKTLCGRVADPEAKADFQTAPKRCPRCVEILRRVRSPRIEASRTTKEHWEAQRSLFDGKAS